MGLLTILKKMKQKERELRLLMLYPPSARAVARVAGPAGWAEPGVGARPPGTHCRWCVTHAALPLLGAGPGRAGPYHSAGWGVACRRQPGGLKAQPRLGTPVSQRGATQ